MIPKILHTIWYGPKQPTDLIRECGLRNRGVLSDWDHRENALSVMPDWASRAIECGSFVNASNFLRLQVLFETGGVYVDGDVQVIKPPPLTDEAFIGFQRADTFEDSLNTAVMGSTPRHPFIALLLERAKRFDPDVAGQVISCSLTTALIREVGIHSFPEKPTFVKPYALTLYPRDYFHPFDWMTGFKPLSITENTCTIHYWSHLWK